MRGRHRTGRDEDGPGSGRAGNTMPLAGRDSRVSSVPGEPSPGPERRSLAGCGVAEALHLTFDLSSPEPPAGPTLFSNLAPSSTRGTQLPSLGGPIF